jgi:phage N-6-adenine-methyltransferase
MALTISDELKSLIPALSPEELHQLEANLLADGCRDPLIVWAETQILLDGHHRHSLCERHSLPFTVQELNLPDLDAARLWMIANQLGRRNLNPNQMSYYRGEQYNLQKRQGKRTDLTSDQNDPKLHSTAAQLAQHHKVSEPTIKRDGAYARAVDTIAETVGPEARLALLSRGMRLTQPEVKVLGELLAETPEAVQVVRDALHGPDPQQTLQDIINTARFGPSRAFLRYGGGVHGSPPPAALVLEPETAEVDEMPAPATWPQKVSSGDPERYTPDEILAPVRQVLGAIDLDPASCDTAQIRVQARTYYTINDDGLRQAWHGKVFLNPPYKLPDVAWFIGKLFEEIEAEHTTEAILLVNSATETDWFQRAFEMADAVCFPDGRIHFMSATRNSDHPCQGQALLYYGNATWHFCEVFAAVGVTTRVVGTKDADPQLSLAAAPTPAPAEAPDPTLPRLQMAVYVMVKKLQPCTNAQVKEALGEKRPVVHAALQALVKKGKIVKEGETYLVVDA